MFQRGNGFFNRVGDFIETAAKVYIFYEENKSKRDYTDEIRLLYDSLQAEREHSRDLRDQVQEHKRQAEQYWALLTKEGYFWDEQKNLLKLQGFLEETDEEEEETEPAKG